MLVQVSNWLKIEPVGGAPCDITEQGLAHALFFSEVMWQFFFNVLFSKSCCLRKTLGATEGDLGITRS